MNKKISFINKLRISITSIKEYKELIKEKLSHVIIYSILLSLIVGAIQGVFSFIAINDMQKTMEKVISSDEFKFTLQDGILNFENSPIKSEEGRNMVYIDTNISLDEIDTIRNVIVHKDASVTLLKDGISYRNNGNEHNFKFSEIPFVGVVDNETLLNSLSLIRIVKYVAFISTIIITYISFMINAFLLSIVGIILNKINRLGLRYENIFKISVYATTLPTILASILPIGSFVLLISGMYLILVVNYLRSDIQI